MTNGDYYLTVDGSQIRLRRNDNIRLVTPARDEHPTTVAARLARSSRLALNPTYPPEFLVVQGERQKLEEVATYPDVQNTRSAFQDSQGHLLVLTNDILISFVDGSSDEDSERLLARFNGRVIERNGEVWKFRVNDTGADAPLLLANELSKESIVNYAEPNALQAAAFQQLPQNEPRFDNQWHLQNTGQNGGTVGADVDAIGAWEITTGSPNVAIVVHDTGVDINHPDLTANIGQGWDFDNSDNDATNNNGPHGTACAGVIAAAVNGQSITGIASGCRIIPLRAAGSHTWQEWAGTFDWAARRGRIISCSWSVTPNNTLSAAIRRAVSNGVTVFCATGNNATRNWSPPILYPANMAETIAVGASTNQDVRADYSQFGSEIDIVAPSSGGTLRIETTDIRGTNGYNAANSPAGDYCNANDGTGFGGTSSATPLAAGIAGLMLSVNPSLTPAEIRVILHETADKIDQPNANYDGNGWSAQYGFGRVNAAAAVQRAFSHLADTGLLMFRSDNNFQPSSVWRSGQGNSDWSRSKVITGDFQGTGKTDIAILYNYLNADTGLLMFRSDNNFQPSSVWRSGQGNSDWSRSKVITGDFQGTGKTDIAILYNYLNADTGLLMFRSDNNFQPSSVWRSGQGNSEWSQSKVITGDFQGTGKTDIAILYNYLNADTGLLMFRSDNNFQPSSVWRSGQGNSEWSQSKVITGDFQGTGKTDIAILYNYLNADTGLLMFRSDNNFQPSSVWRSGQGNSEWSQSKVITGDFQGTGKTDIAVLYNYR